MTLPQFGNAGLGEASYNTATSSFGITDSASGESRLPQLANESFVCEKTQMQQPMDNHPGTQAFFSMDTGNAASRE